MNVNRFRNWLTGLIVLMGLSWTGYGQTTPVDTAHTKQYAIEVAGIKVGTMTANRQQRDKQSVVYTLISDVKVNFLVYKVKIYYKVVSLVQQGKLIRSTVDAHTNKGNFSSRTEWKGDHYEITADQYKYTHKGTETRLIDYTVTDMFFSEPTNRNRAYSEYFGDYFTLTSPIKGTYQATLNDREDEYHYENGQLVKIIKKNPLKNFIIRPIRK
ncbi:MULTISPECIES: DUF6134 family protein [unclassified Spirosoma]|uniref:DUF6134 family protein n=1 Tax=unclassified Spirosoma TaxID=2621999 RepID=UPI0009599C76|nr:MULTISPECIES: DUF6134 family protein [unclassified Spirosoma]MBN8825413.1 hypothetical protein [Spirosoma sp.]OJW74924.1 MAG: hypothetical protein BGO59_05350 [Spirosoma sp. 48-14]